MQAVYSSTDVGGYYLDYGCEGDLKCICNDSHKDVLWVVSVLWLQDELDQVVYLTSLYCTTMDLS